MVFDNSGGSGNRFFPAFLPGKDAIGDAQLTEDRYDIYVNDDYVGHKTLETAGENLSDVDDFIRTQGIKDFTSSLDGDHYTIHADGKADDIKDVLEVYLKNR